MMKKTLTLFLTFAFIVSYSQYRFIYKYNFVPDCTKKDSIVHDLMTLDVDAISKKSNFYNEAKRYNDSILNTDTKGDLPKLFFLKYNPNLTYSITKDLKNDRIAHHIIPFGVKMKVTEKERPKWNLTVEEKKIGGFLCQKAKAEFKGRSWTAWFTREIPISEGPYKFSGLPGLIVEIYDSEKEHQFSLIEVEKKHIQLPNFSKKEKEITPAQLNKLKEAGNDNPNANIKEMHITNNNYTFLLNDGNVLKMDRSVKNVDSEVSKQMKRMTNTIEIEKK